MLNNLNFVMSCAFTVFTFLFPLILMIFSVSCYRQAIELTERTSPEQAQAIREPLNNVNRRWENLLRSLVDRQKQLEHALLHLGQFQHALNELLVWIGRTESTLDQLKPVRFLSGKIFKEKFLTLYCSLTDSWRSTTA